MTQILNIFFQYFINTNINATLVFDKTNFLIIYIHQPKIWKYQLLHGVLLFVVLLSPLRCSSFPKQLPAGELFVPHYHPDTLLVILLSHQSEFAAICIRKLAISNTVSLNFSNCLIVHHHHHHHQWIKIEVIWNNLWQFRYMYIIISCRINQPELLRPPTHFQSLHVSWCSSVQLWCHGQDLQEYWHISPVYGKVHPPHLC